MPKIATTLVESVRRYRAVRLEHNDTAHVATFQTAMSIGGVPPWQHRIYVGDDLARLQVIGETAQRVRDQLGTFVEDR